MNNQTFAVGEIAILQNCIYKGQEVTIMGPLALRTVLEQSTGNTILAMVYETDFVGATGKALGALPEQLKKKPPREEWSGELRVLEMFNASKQSKEITA